MKVSLATAFIFVPILFVLGSFFQERASDHLGELQNICLSLFSAIIGLSYYYYEYMGI